MFGMGYGRTLVTSHVIISLGGVTADEALARGDNVGDVWRALCEDHDVPSRLHWGVSRESSQ